LIQMAKAHIRQPNAARLEAPATPRCKRLMCNREYEKVRAHQKFCSDACRVQDWHERRAAPSLRLPRP
jgi:hypothetical protein